MNLHDFLCTAYQTRCGDRVPGAGQPLAVDDASGGDQAHLVCQIQVLVTGPRQFTLQFMNLPRCEAVHDLFDEYYGKIRAQGNIHIASLALDVKQVRLLRDLAKFFRRAVGRGASYLDPNWKWICPRVAKSLDELAGHVQHFRSVTAKGHSVR